MAAPQRKEPEEPITQLLRRLQDGDKQAFDDLLPIIYDKLKRIATNQLRGESGSHTLSPTALVHEAFLKLRESGSVSARDRSHFFAIAARTMRWLLVDHAKLKKSAKRGGYRAVRVAFDENRHSPAQEVDLGALEEALHKLEAQDARACRVVELRQLVGLSIEETAEALGTSPMTVKRDWLFAKAWLARELGTKS
jgi:RNA polymerase sigma factor (TIGR02999 family)